MMTAEYKELAVLGRKKISLWLQVWQGADAQWAVAGRKLVCVLFYISFGQCHSVCKLAPINLPPSCYLGNTRLQINMLM